jgi:hypothetical protein
MGEIQVILTSVVVVNDQLRAPAALLLGKEPPVPIG